MKNFVFLWSVTVLVGSCSFLFSAKEKASLSNCLEGTVKYFFMTKGATGAIKHCIPSISKNRFISNEDIHYECIVFCDAVLHHKHSIKTNVGAVAEKVAKEVVISYGVRKAIDIGLAGANKISLKIRHEPLINTKEHADAIENVKIISFLLLTVLLHKRD